MKFHWQLMILFIIALTACKNTQNEKKNQQNGSGDLEARPDSGGVEPQYSLGASFLEATEKNAGSSSPYSIEELQVQSCSFIKDAGKVGFYWQFGNTEFTSATKYMAVFIQSSSLPVTGSEFSIPGDNQKLNYVNLHVTAENIIETFWSSQSTFKPLPNCSLSVKKSEVLRTITTVEGQKMNEFRISGKLHCEDLGTVSPEVPRLSFIAELGCTGMDIHNFTD